MNLYRQICNEDFLSSSWRLVYRRKSNEKRKRGKDIDGLTLSEYKKTAGDRIKLLLKALKEKNHKVSSLRGFYIGKPGKKSKRLIGIPCVNDRITQRAILTTINPIMIPLLKKAGSFGCISRREIREDNELEPLGIKGAMNLFKKSVSKKKFWVFKSDIKSFYDEIPRERLYGRLIRLLPDNSINKLLRKYIFSKWGNPEDLFEKGFIIDYKKGIAQGPILSPLFSNIYLKNFDNRMKRLYGNNYIRYADDFIVLCKNENEATEAKEIARSLLLKDKLELHPDEETKTLIINIAQKPLVYLGLKVTRHMIFCKKTSSEIKITLNELINSNLSKKEKIEKVNAYTRGIYESYKDYHCQKLFEDINIMISNKKRLKNFSKLELLDWSNSEPIVSQPEWQSYFRAN